MRHSRLAVSIFKTDPNCPSFVIVCDFVEAQFGWQKLRHPVDEGTCFIFVRHSSSALEQGGKSTYRYSGLNQEPRNAVTGLADLDL